METTEKQLKKIMKSLTKEVDKARERIMVKVSEELYFTITGAIDDFYSDYKPRFYDRYGDLRDHLIFEERREEYVGNYSFGSKKTNLVYVVTLDPSLMIHHDEDERFDIVDLTIREGMHGRANHVTSPTPYALMQEGLKKIEADIDNIANAELAKIRL